MVLSAFRNLFNNTHFKIETYLTINGEEEYHSITGKVPVKVPPSQWKALIVLRTQDACKAGKIKPHTRPLILIHNHLLGLLNSDALKNMNIEQRLKYIKNSTLPRNITTHRPYPR